MEIVGQTDGQKSPDIRGVVSVPFYLSQSKRRVNKPSLCLGDLAGEKGMTEFLFTVAEQGHTDCR